MAKGRPSKYSDALADLICTRLIDGESLLSICKDADMPNAQTVFAWILSKPDFSNKYARAREVQADTMADQILTISDDGKNDWMEKHGSGDVGWQLNGEHVQRSRLRVDARKWLASKMAPKKYGDKVTLAGDESQPLAVVIKDEWAAK